MATKNTVTSTNYPSLKAIGAVLELQSMQRLYNIAKTPIPGELYDPKVINYEAIGQFINRQLTKEVDTLPFDSVEEVLEAAREWEEQNPSGRAPRGSGAAAPKDHSTRRFKQWEMSADNTRPIIVLRGNKKQTETMVYCVVYQTSSHTVVRPVVPVGWDTDAQWSFENAYNTPNGEGLQFLDESVRLISNSVLNLKGLGPTNAYAEAIKRWTERNWEKSAEAESTDGNEPDISEE